MSKQGYETIGRYTYSRMARIADDKYEVINKIHYVNSNSKEYIDIINQIIKDASHLCRGEIFSVDDLFFQYSGPHKDIVNDCRGFVDMLCFKHRAEEDYCRRMACLIVSLASQSDFQSAQSAYMFFSFTSSSIASLIDAPARLGANGGRPSNRHKMEALEFAKTKWGQIPGTSISAVSTLVKTHLESKYTDAPRTPTIKKWLTDAKIKPTKKDGY